MTSREAAIITLGLEDVEAYRRVKSFFTKFGVEIEKVYAEAVGGTRGARGGGGPDVKTPLGEFEFCASERSKNAAGNAAQIARVPAGHVVQATGPPVKGRIMGQDFLRMHGVADPHRKAGELLIEAMERASA
jgi:hypothetical protein